MNSLYQQLNKSPSSQNNSVVNVFKSLRTMSNPTEALNTMVRNNPRFKSVLNMMHTSKMSPKDLFYTLAQQKGVDPESILNQFK